MAVALHHERPPKPRNLPAFAQRHRADPRNAHLRLVFIELERMVTMRELQLPPAARRPKSWETGCLPALDSTKDGGEGEVQAVQHGILKFAIT